MKLNKGAATAAELLTTMAIITIVGTAMAIASIRAIDASKIASKKSELAFEAQNALEKLAGKIRLANIETFTRTPCRQEDNCLGDRIQFKIAIQTENTPGDPSTLSYFDENGNIKYGAYDGNGIGDEGCWYEYRIFYDLTTPPMDLEDCEEEECAGELMETLLCNRAYCGNNVIDENEDCQTCPADVEFVQGYVCDAADACGDGVCVGNENGCNCHVDDDPDGAGPYESGDCAMACCGQRGCETGETCLNCTVDCGVCGGATGPYDS